MKTLIKKSFVVLAFPFMFGCSKLNPKIDSTNLQNQSTTENKEEKKQIEKEKVEDVFIELLTPKMALDLAYKKINVDETIRVGMQLEELKKGRKDFYNKVVEYMIALGNEKFESIDEEDYTFIRAFRQYFHAGSLMKLAYWYGDNPRYESAFSALKLQDVRTVVLFKAKLGDNDLKKRDMVANAILKASESGLSELNDQERMTLIGYSEFLIYLPKKPSPQMVEAKRKKEEAEREQKRRDQEAEDVARKAELEALQSKKAEAELALEKQKAEKEKQRAEKERLDREREEKAKAEEAKQAREERSRFAMLVGTRGTFEKEAQEKTKDIRELTDRIVAKERIFFQKWEDYLKSIKMTKEEADALIKRGRREKWPE